MTKWNINPTFFLSQFLQGWVVTSLSTTNCLLLFYCDFNNQFVKDSRKIVTVSPEWLFINKITVKTHPQSITTTTNHVAQELQPCRCTWPHGGWMICFRCKYQLCCSDDAAQTAEKLCFRQSRDAFDFQYQTNIFRAPGETLHVLSK